ncbi:hypothetical protein CZ794_02235 [Psychrobacter sp. JB385]|nr:hypothetical protein CZ794_02235 [Psychrobacter sp. JB385]
MGVFDYFYNAGQLSRYASYVSLHTLVSWQFGYFSLWHLTGDDPL